MTAPRGPRDTTRAHKLVERAQHKIAEAFDLLSEVTSILQDVDSRTGRKDPSKRPRLIKRKPGV